MIAYIRGGFDEAMHIAREWAIQNEREVVSVNQKDWHTEHDLENLLCYVVGPRSKLPECNECIIFAYGHTPPEGVQYIRVDRPYQPLSFNDFLRNYRKMGDHIRDPEFAVMLKRYLPKEIVASWLFINYEERRRQYERNKTG